MISTYVRSTRVHGTYVHVRTIGTRVRTMVCTHVLYQGRTYARVLEMSQLSDWKRARMCTEKWCIWPPYRYVRVYYQVTTVTMVHCVREYVPFGTMVHVYTYCNTSGCSTTGSARYQVPWYVHVYHGTIGIGMVRFKSFLRYPYHQ